MRPWSGPCARLPRASTGWTSSPTIAWGCRRWTRPSATPPGRGPKMPSTCPSIPGSRSAALNASIKSFLAAALGCLLLAACGQSAAPAGSSGPNAASSGAASSQTSAAWQQVVADGRREGTLNILAQGGTDVAKGLTESFQKLYPDIKIELLAGNGSEVASKLLTERAAGRYTSDLIVHGTTTIVSSLLPENALDPIVPLLTGPNDSDPSKWRTGNYNFADSAGKYDLIFTGGVHIPLIYSPSLASATDIPSFKSLLDPKWKGKIAMYDPRGAGSGLSMATLF